MLEAICNASTMKTDAPTHIAFLFSDEAFNIYNTLLSSSINDVNQYDFLKAFVNWLSTLGNNFITKIKSGRETFLSLMLALTRLTLINDSFHDLHVLEWIHSDRSLDPYSPSE